MQAAVLEGPGNPVVKEVPRRRISASLMCADLLRLERDLDALAAGGADWLHVDVMDGHYVPNFTLGPDFCRAAARHSPLPLDIHLMIENVDAYVPVFSAFPGCTVCIHPEVSYHPVRTLQLVRASGARPGIAIDPSVPADRYSLLLPWVDLVCVMTVNPGYAGQKLVPSALRTVAEAAGLIRREGRPIDLEVDGNVSWENIPGMVAAGADVLVAGTSSLFDGKALLGENLARMRRMLEGGSG